MFQGFFVISQALEQRTHVLICFGRSWVEFESALILLTSRAPVFLFGIDISQIISGSRGVRHQGKATKVMCFGFVQPVSFLKKICQLKVVSGVWTDAQGA